MLSNTVKGAIKTVLASTSSAYARFEKSMFKDCRDCRFFLKNKNTYGKCMVFNARKWEENTCVKFERKIDEQGRKND